MTVHFTHSNRGQYRDEKAFFQAVCDQVNIECRQNGPAGLDGCKLTAIETAADWSSVSLAFEYSREPLTLARLKQAIEDKRRKAA